MLESFGLSDVGRVRRLNEDTFVVREDLAFFAVCDGLGGHKAGEVASALTVEAMTPFIEASHADTEVTWPFGFMINLSFDGNRLFTAIGLANKRVFREADKKEYSKMGSTVVAAIVRDTTLTVAWLGDSRAYLLRGGTLERITTDHTWINMAVASGLVKPEDAERHPWKDVLTKAVGSQDSFVPDVASHALAPGDLILLCSDGLTKMVGEQAIARHLTSKARSVEASARLLVDAANEAGGKDNTTVVLVRFA
jgi:protein phosphatase